MCDTVEGHRVIAPVCIADKHSACTCRRVAVTFYTGASRKREEHDKFHTRREDQCVKSWRHWQTLRVRERVYHTLDVPTPHSELENIEPLI